MSTIQDVMAWVRCSECDGWEHLKPECLTCDGAGGRHVPKARPSLYLGGPMSGLPDLNFPAFHAAALRLREAGYPTINPADFGCDPKHTWRDCMARDIAVLVHQEAVVVLPGWESSRGATLEVHVARALGMPVWTLEEALSRCEKTPRTIGKED